MAKLYITDLPSVPDKFDKLDDVQEYLTDVVKTTGDQFDIISREINGRIELVNMFITAVTVTDTGTANTDFAVTHNLGRTTVYYISNINTSPLSGNATFYKGSTAWTDKIAYLRCTLGNLNVTFIVVA